MSGLTEPEIHRLIYDYIGVDKGYLMHFSYEDHRTFYSRYCDLTIDVQAWRAVHGTTRKTFEAILREASDKDQARIVEGTFRYLPIEKFAADERPSKVAVRSDLQRAVLRIRGQAVGVDDLSQSSETVLQAIRDADVLIRESGNTSGVDRIHTALHGYLRSLCKELEIPGTEDADVGRLLKLLRQYHPKMEPQGPRAEDVAKIQQALATIISTLNPLRNQATLAHPNDELLPPAEAALVIDVTRSLMNYLTRRLS